ncbi:MAG TPA: hypothetical protein PL067_04855 [Bacteroidales bacterium]|jgi:hypothetical protein|nr:hypothetical protein [Deltaproteobacteria bacterium]HOY73846.1 hypothetical protein [Deltaproteobacteria bacterium]HPH51656.1 hypothetical protein [Deltaproteobacteria bacterium]HPO40035.1 hypothetical protein [Bacteroidales bacterium]HRW81704.1 hypothetical protein [Desulfomonilia bacterium]
MHEIHLTWNGPYTFKDIILGNTELQTNAIGVYFHTEEIDGKTFISYAGKAMGAPGLVKRQLQHYLHFIGGMYNIPSDYRGSQREWVPDNKHYNKKENREYFETIFDKDKFLTLVGEAFGYVQKLRIYLASEMFEKQDIPLIERKLLYAFQPLNTFWGTTSDACPDIVLKHEGAVPGETVSTWIDNNKHFSGFRSGSHRGVPPE